MATELSPNQPFPPLRQTRAQMPFAGDCFSSMKLLPKVWRIFSTCQMSDFQKRYDGVPFSSQDFHQPYCEINNYGNADEVNNVHWTSSSSLLFSAKSTCPSLRFKHFINSPNNLPLFFIKLAQNFLRIPSNISLQVRNCYLVGLNDLDGGKQ